MFDATWSQAILSALIPLTGLSAVGIVAWIVVHRLETMRRRTQERIDDLERRVSQVETKEPGVSETSQLPISSAAATRPRGMSHREPSSSSPTLIVVPDLAEGGRAVDPQVEANLKERHGEVWALASSGAAPEEIARRTGQPIGQVELIVGLHRQVTSSRGPLDHARSH
jgi:hypothetical protein